MTPFNAEVIHRLRMSSRPVMFTTGVKETPCAIAGTAFLVGFRKHLYLVTAAHVTKGAESSLFVLPREDAAKPLHFTRWWPVQVFQDDQLDSEASDISTVRIDLKKIPRTDRENSHVINLNGLKDWFETRLIADFFLCGYPKMENSIDYVRREVNTAQYFLVGRYSRPNRHSSSTYQLQIENPLGLTDFDGLSGSPVFSVSPLNNNSAPKFCGMALRGSAQSNIVHFLEADAIVRTLAEVEKD